MWKGKRDASPMRRLSKIFVESCQWQSHAFGQFKIDRVVDGQLVEVRKCDRCIDVSGTFCIMDNLQDIGYAIQCDRTVSLLYPAAPHGHGQAIRELSRKDERNMRAVLDNAY